MILLVGSLTVVVTLVFLSYPLILDAVSGGVYDRPVRAMDVLGGGRASGGGRRRCRRRALHRAARGTAGSGAAAIAPPSRLARARTAARC